MFTPTTTEPGFTPSGLRHFRLQGSLRLDVGAVPYREATRIIAAIDYGDCEIHLGGQQPEAYPRSPFCSWSWVTTSDANSENPPLEYQWAMVVGTLRALRLGLFAADYIANDSTNTVYDSVRAAIATLQRRLATVIADPEAIGQRLRDGMQAINPDQINALRTMLDVNIFGAIAVGVL